MTFLPIVERELRVAVRKRSTAWLRVAAGLIALVIAGGVIILSSVARVRMASFGASLFGILTWLGLIAALCSGLFFTADCLSEEKRQGTLGFLFLTDLRGYDVVLGKLLATSLRGFYALLAVLPILGITLLMGGVAVGQFWRTSFALIHALFFSLASGMVISAISRDSQRALAGTFALLLLLSAGGPLADWLRSEAVQRPFKPCFSLGSPVFLFLSAGAWGQSGFWVAFLVGEFLAWGLLGMGCLLIPRAWQDFAAKPKHYPAARVCSWKYGSRKQRDALRRELLGRNPVLWLACRERWQGLGLWILALVLLAGAVGMLFTAPSPQLSIAISSVASVLNLVLYLWIASHACRFFIEARRTGLLELLLATPLDAREIVRGQWLALVRLFGAPLLLLLLSQIVATCFARQAAWSAATVAVGSRTPNAALVSTVAVISTLAGLANLVALAWFGMWMGMTSKHISWAILKAILFVQLIPWFAFSFVTSLVMILVVMRPVVRSATGTAGTTLVTTMTVWYPLLTAVLAAILSGGKDVGFFVWARRKLYTGFREQASRVEIHRSIVTAPPVIPGLPVKPGPSSLAPPLISQ